MPYTNPPDALRRIAEALRNGATWLDLRGTRVTDAIGPHLPPGLTKLYLWGTGVTDAGVAALRAARPGLTIFR